MTTDTVTPRTPPDDRADRSPARRGLRVAVAALGSTLLLGVAAVAVGASRGDGGDPSVGGKPLVLELEGGAATASCLPLSVDVLAGMSPAFAATATDVDGDRVTLAVDRWFRGAAGETVVVRADPGAVALVAGFAFEVSRDYLVTASNGVVNTCGYSGPATAELRAAFEEAFVG
jgi:hypothetical protein